MKNNNVAPYLSFVGFARNDDYIPDRAQKHNASLNFLLQQLKDFKIPSEIILVEWNYPEDRPPLAETISIKVDSPYTSIRIIRVPSSYHQQYKYWQHRPFITGGAVNVGIRRAKGKFILPIASDVFLTDACFEIISKQALDENAFYRCDRYDVNRTDLMCFEESRNVFFENCEKNVKVHHKKLVQESSFEIADLHTNACGDFYLTSKDLLEKVRGNKEGKDIGGLDIDSLVIHALDGVGAKQEILSNKCKVFKVFHNKTTAVAIRQIWKPWQRKLENYLMRKGCTTRTVNNFRIFFNYPKRTFSYTAGALFDSFEKNFVKPARRWAKKHPPFYLNGKDWGLRNEKLEEVILKP
ncbi:MAG: hypothetical protein K2Q34_07795 [Alphaproteobacteria bacterium]|nr:hypothetical protein [Alphaproteobacteria bacterium]